jgi:hypothetical protein
MGPSDLLSVIRMPSASRGILWNIGNRSSICSQAGAYEEGRHDCTSMNLSMEATNIYYALQMPNSIALMPGKHTSVGLYCCRREIKHEGQDAWSSTARGKD